MTSLLTVCLGRPEKFWHIEIPGEPQAWKRAGRGKFGHTFNASKNEQKTIAWQVVAACPDIRRNRIRFWGVRFRFFCASRAPKDADNLAKNYLDGLQGTVWKNDKMIRELYVAVIPSAMPRTEMVLYEIAEATCPS